MNKKLLVVSIVVFITVITIFLSLFIYRSKNSADTTYSSQNSGQNVTGKTLSNTLSYSSSYFTFSYPQVFTLIPGTPDVNGYVVALNSSKGFSPSAVIIIQESPATGTSLKSLENIQSAFGFRATDSRVGVNSLPGITYRGVLSFSPVKTQKLVTLFEDAGTIYKIDLSYDAPLPNAQLEDFYHVVLMSFKPR